MIKLIYSLLLLPTLSFANSDSQQCGNTVVAEQLVNLIKSDPLQKRAYLKCDSRLVSAASKKVKDMAEAEFVFHGRANGRLRDEGVELPKYYGIGNANQVEALAGGQATAKVVWQGFKNSKSHADHLLARNDFYLKQYLIGAAYLHVPSTAHNYYWAVYITEEDNASKRSIFYGPIPNKTSEGVLYQLQQ
jgi:uncharacterized protein YkwD